MSNEEEMVTIEEPTPEPATKEPTKLDEFVKRLSIYSNKEEAKAHIPDIASKIKCAKSLGYKAIKKIEFSGEPKKGQQAKELTAKIEDQEAEPLTEEQAQEDSQGEETPEPLEEPAPPQVPITAKALTTSIELAFKKAAKLMDYPDLALTHEEAESLTNCWTPVLEYYAPQLSNNPIVWAVIGTAIILAPRTIGLVVEKFNKRKTEKPIIIDVKPEKPKEEPKPEAPLETPPTITETAQKENEKPKTAPFMNNL